MSSLSMIHVPRPASAHPLVTRAFGAMWVIVLLFVSFTGWRGLVLQSWRLYAYVPVAATVLETDFEDAAASIKGEAWQAVVRYEYHVGGRRYESTRVTPTSSPGSYARAVRQARAYEPGATATAYYDPDHPTSAFLLRERDPSLEWFAVIPLALLVAGARVLGYSLLRRRKAAG